MSNKRLNEVVQMFSHISGKGYDESKEIILFTETGKTIQEESSAVMYEQQTENLYSVIRELCENNYDGAVTDLFTVESIATALIKIGSDSKQEGVLGVVIQKNPEQKEKNRELLKAHRKRMLQQKQQNQINVRRMSNADKFKRENKQEISD